MRRSIFVATHSHQSETATRTLKKVLNYSNCNLLFPPLGESSLAEYTSTLPVKSRSLWH